MPGLASENSLLRNHADELMRMLRRRYPHGRTWFQKDYDDIGTDLREFRLELMNSKLVFALWDCLREVGGWVFCGWVCGWVCGAKRSGGRRGRRGIGGGGAVVVGVYAEGWVPALATTTTTTQPARVRALS